MIQILKALCLAGVIAGVAGVSMLRDVVEPELAATLAVRQFDGTDESIQNLRTYDLAKHTLDWLWVLIPVTALALYAGKTPRRRDNLPKEAFDETG